MTTMYFQTFQQAQNDFVSEILKDLNKLEEAENRLVNKVGGEEILNKDQ